MDEAKLGRPQLEVDMEAALDLLLARGERVPAVAQELGISEQTLRNRIAEIQKKQGLLLQYRSIQALQLTELQARILEAVTPEKINSAPLRDLILSYKILKEKELVIEGKPSEIKGLIAHLIYLEQQEQQTETSGTLLDAEFDDSTNETSVECDKKSLSMLDLRDW